MNKCRCSKCSIKRQKCDKPMPKKSKKPTAHNFCVENCEHEDGYPCTYIDTCVFERKALVKITTDIAKLCNTCPHQNDGHYANCIECCPLTKVVSYLAGLDGKTVSSGTQHRTYIHTVLCNTKDLPKKMRR